LTIVTTFDWLSRMDGRRSEEMAAEELKSDEPPLSSTKARRGYDEKDPPCRNTIIAIWCLRICFLVILAMELMMVAMALSNGQSDLLRNNEWQFSYMALFVMFVVLWPTTYWLRRRSIGAWFMALLEFALYMFLGYGGLSSSGVCGTLVVQLPIGAFGIVNLLARSCRKEFGID
jgi:hypothetical protein